MVRQNKGIIIVVTVFALVVVASIFLFYNRIDIPVPDDFAQVESFTDDYAVNLIELTGTDTLIENKNAETYQIKLETGDKSVTLAAGRFPGRGQAGDSLSNFKKNKGNLYHKLVEMTLPWYGAYWSATTGGITYSGWYKGRWVILLKGNNREAVKSMEKDLKKYLHNE